MEGTSSIILIIMAIDILTIVFIVKDDRYFFDDEKLKLSLLVIFLPIVGSIYVLSKLRDDIRWYVGFAGVALILLCTSHVNRLDFYYCMKILSQLGKLLNR